MEPKPPGWSRAYGEWFGDASMVENYRFRPEYPAALFPFLASLAGPSGAVLDAGCGPADLAWPLAPLVGRVDAVDLSPLMIREGRGRADGAAPNLVWLAGAIEDVELDGPYDLVVAGDSVHWFDWQVVVPRFAAELAPSGRLAVVSRNWFTAPELRRRLGPVYARLARTVTSACSTPSPSWSSADCSSARESARPLQPSGARRSTRSSAATTPRTASTWSGCRPTRSRRSTPRWKPRYASSCRRARTVGSSWT